MIRAFEGTINPDGIVRLFEPVTLAGPRRAVVMVFDEEPANRPNETAILSEAALAEDWNRPEEDAAWAYLQSAT